MAVKRAKIIEPQDLKKIFKLIDSEHSEKTRDKITVLLSVKAGLRAAEIAGLKWTNVLKANGEVAEIIEIPSNIAKGGRARQVPLHPEIQFLLKKLRKERPADMFIRYGDYKTTVTPNNLTVWFHRLYQKVGLEGCSSHSGRRTFITTTARIANLYNASLKDVQMIAGHRHLSTTERYIEPSVGARNMVAAI